MAIAHREPPGSCLNGRELHRRIDLAELKQMRVGRAIGLVQPVAELDLAARIGAIAAAVAQ